MAGEQRFLQVEELPKDIRKLDYLALFSENLKYCSFFLSMPVTESGFNLFCP